MRITSRKLKTRKKCLKKLGRKLPDDFPEKNNVNLLKDFCNLLLKKFEGLSDYDYEDYETVKSKFLYWRQLTQKLGRLTWRSHKRQIIFFYISILLFGINIVIK
ncbi:hypothetical protein JCM19298_1926 [Nonlabens ulvanivorans]|nr:hypothetical protein JCM19298_1926 [Nonlabens ulvanivorans]